MLYNETYRKYFDNNGLKNVFIPLTEIGDSQTERWIYKLQEEFNRYLNYIVLISKYEKVPADHFTLTALHESLSTSSVTIAFCIFSIFALITRTEASFFDDHIKDYFKGKVKLNREEMKLLSFKWHTSIHTINSLSYSCDERLCICNSDNKIGFKILNNITTKSSYNTRKRDEPKITYSTEFFFIHLLMIISTLDLLASLLSDKWHNMNPDGTQQRNSYLEIENIDDFMLICENILPSLE